MKNIVQLLRKKSCDDKHILIFKNGVRNSTTMKDSRKL